MDWCNYSWNYSWVNVWLGVLIMNEPVAWMPAFGFERFYEVSNQGDVRRIGSNKCLAKNLMGAGYVKADLWVNNKRTQTSVHRLVALTFLPPPHDGMEVNHKDGDKTNNHVSNLEWVTRSANEKHSREELGNLCKPVKAICLKTGEVRIYSSQTATARDGFEPKCVSDICRKEDRYTHKGWAFEYYTHPVNPKYDPETGEPLIDGYPLFSGLSHPVTEHFEGEPQAEELHEILKSYNEPLNYEVTHPRWSKEKEFFANWNYPQKTYEDGIEECAQRAESYAYMSPNFTALAEELRAILRKVQEHG